MTNTLTTNIIRNVFNIGTNSCDVGTQYCSEGYALYFPCLKDITKGQDACWEFYVADYGAKGAYNLATSDPNISDDDLANLAGKETVDLRDVDAISLNLIGAFNCPYGTYTYPDNISSLQTEEYPVMYREDFGERKLCHLSVFMLDTEASQSEQYYNTLESDFYSGTLVEVEANDTPTHIFLGWAILNMNEDEDCPEETWEENIICKDNIYRFVIQEDIIVLALYRPRKMYSVISDPTNKSSHFTLDYNHRVYHISNRIEDGYDIIEHSYIPYDEVTNVLEGYHLVAKCVPAVDVLGSEPDEMFRFVEWKDKVKSRCRLFKIGEDTTPFEDGDVIKLKVKCDGPVPYEPIEDENIPYLDEFDEEGIHINTEFNEVDIYDYYGDGVYVLSAEEAYQKFIGETGYLFLHFGNVTLSSVGIEDGIKINIEAKADDYCELWVTVNDATAKIPVSTEEFKLYEVYFKKCDKSDIEITAYGDCLIDMIEVCKEEIIDRGKAQFCLPADVTANLPSGPLSVNGAIMVDGKTYGLATTSIGSVNKLPKITINM